MEEYTRQIPVSLRNPNTSFGHGVEINLLETKIRTQHNPVWCLERFRFWEGSFSRVWQPDWFQEANTNRYDFRGVS